MRAAIDETNRRRVVQEQYNRDHGIEPRSITKAIDDPLVKISEADYGPLPEVTEESPRYPDLAGVKREVETLRREMKEAAARLEFEKAAELRDRALRLEREELGVTA
jgi:excinuclease ABC subunit B